MQRTLAEYNSRDALLAVTALRERFLADRSTDLSSLRPVIARSWQRTVAAGVRPYPVGIATVDDARIDEQTLRCAEPILQELKHTAADVGGTVYLIDPSGRIVSDLSGSADARFPSGVSALEDALGTNSDGTALEEGRSVQVWSREHFREDLQDSCCTSAVVRDPLRRNVRAVISLALPERVALDSDPRSIALIMEGVAANISQALAARMSSQEQALMTEYLATLRRGGNDAIIAMDGRTTIASNGALELLGSNDYAAIAGYAEAAFHEGRMFERDVVVSGDRVIRLEANPVSDGYQTVGMIVRAREHGRSRRAEGDRQVMSAIAHSSGDGGAVADLSRGLVGDSPVMKRVFATAARIAERRSPAHIVGERGTGKYGLASRIAAAMSTSVDELDCGRQSDAALLVNSITTSLKGDRSVLLRRVDSLDAETTEVLAEAMTAFSKPALIMTVSRATNAHAALFAAVGSTEISMPPLRSRREDIPTLVQSVLAGLHHGSETQHVTSGLLRELSKADWPGNVAQLRDVIVETAAAAGQGKIDVDHLPWSFRRSVAKASLSRMEEAELHELRQAMIEANGNRTLAADILQIGRSTLYRRIETYRRRGLDITA